MDTGEGSAHQGDVSPQPKINSEDFERTHDRVTRYAKDPTAKNGCQSSEATELEQLGMAPPPPTEAGNTYIDMKQSYDQLQTRNQDDPESYTAFEVQPPQEDYVNTGAIEKELGISNEIYVNTETPPETNLNSSATAGPSNTQAAASIPSQNAPGFGDPKRPYLTQPQESQEMYEPIGQDAEPQEIYANDPRESENVGGEPQEIYANDPQESKTVGGESQEIYANDPPEEIYANQSAIVEEDIYEN